MFTVGGVAAKGYGNGNTHLLKADTRTVCRVKSHPVDHYGSSVGIIGGRPVACTGRRGELGYQKACWQYNANNNTWVSEGMPTMPLAQLNAARVLVNNRSGFILMNGNNMSDRLIFFSTQSRAKQRKAWLCRVVQCSARFLASPEDSQAFEDIYNGVDPNERFPFGAGYLFPFGE